LISGIAVLMLLRKIRQLVSLSLIHIHPKLQPQIVHNLLQRHRAINRDHSQNLAQQPPLCVLYAPSNTGGTHTGVLDVKLGDSEETFLLLYTADETGGEGSELDAHGIF
jgi:hypothetical protein